MLDHDAVTTHTLDLTGPVPGRAGHPEDQQNNRYDDRKFLFLFIDKGHFMTVRTVFVRCQLLSWERTGMARVVGHTQDRRHNHPEGVAGCHDLAWQVALYNRDGSSLPREGLLVITR